MSNSIPKGATVTVCTTNGGEITGRLSARYVPSYALELVGIDRPIMAQRIVSVCDRSSLDLGYGDARKWAEKEDAAALQVNLDAFHKSIIAKIAGV